MLYEALPNELPRVAGIISTFPQTPLSHVNLRAAQDGIPNAFIRGARDDPDLTALLDSYVRYEVTETGYSLRAAMQAEVDAHYEASRSTQPQTPQRDLSVTEITPLSEIGFADWDAFGVKAANVAELRKLGFPEGTVPDGFAISFYFYDKFMTETALGEATWLGYKGEGVGVGLDAETTLEEAVEAMLAHSAFRTDFKLQDEMLDDLRDAIEDVETPEWLIEALTEMNTSFDESFGEGRNRRYRSSTNNEDLPGFNGARLYDSKSQKPSEDEEDLGKSLKEVYASLWNFRAFSERAFHRIDHKAAAMGILVHPSYQAELVNGVAVSFDPVFGLDGEYYVNSQVGEDLVTNPEAHSVPEEILLHQYYDYIVLATSNQVPPGQLLMSNDQMDQLRRHLKVIHDHFKTLYNPGPGEPFAMEIEFKITSDNILAIKQARPWVFSAADAPREGNGSGGGGGGGPRQTVPDAPSNLLADDGDEAVTMIWDAPENDDGAAITDYEYRIDGRGRWASIGSTHTTHTVTGLVNGTAYAFEVRAVNRIGKSRASNQAEATPRAAVVLDFAHFANGTGITSDLVFVNLSTQPSGPPLTPFHSAIPPSRPAIYFYDTEGALVAADSVVDVTGDLEITEDGALTVQMEMDPLGALTISTHGRGELVSGSVRVVSEGPIDGMLRFDLPTPRRRHLPGTPPGGGNHHRGRAPQPGIECGAGALRLEARGRAARRREYLFGGQRANVLAHRPGVPRRRYVQLRGVGALRCSRP